eukprot:Skav233116  [mRNA]  locus=scaffold1342:358799:361812:- [translate_table: standard]
MSNVHSLFLDGEQLSIPAAEVDQACKDLGSKYDSNGALVLEYDTRCLVGISSWLSTCLYSSMAEVPVLRLPPGPQHRHVRRRLRGLSLAVLGSALAGAVAWCFGNKVTKGSLDLLQEKWAVPSS